MTQSPEPETETNTQQDDDQQARSLVYQYRYVIIVSLIFIGLSIVYALTYFPELSTIRAIVAGLGFGLFCSMCAATYSQLI